MLFLQLNNQWMHEPTSWRNWLHILNPVQTSWTGMDPRGRNSSPVGSTSLRIGPGLPKRAFDDLIHVDLPRHAAAVTKKPKGEDRSIERGCLLPREDARTAAGDLFPEIRYRVAGSSGPTPGHQGRTLVRHRKAMVRHRSRILEFETSRKSGKRT